MKYFDKFAKAAYKINNYRMIMLADRVLFAIAQKLRRIKGVRNLERVRRGSGGLHTRLTRLRKNSATENCSSIVIDPPRKTRQHEVGNFCLRGSLCTRLAGTIAVNVTQVTVSSKSIELGWSSGSLENRKADVLLMIRPHPQRGWLSRTRVLSALRSGRRSLIPTAAEGTRGKRVLLC